jgi:L-malate glycosyltransferase
MHNITKIKLFRTLLWIVYPFALLFVYPFVLLKRKQKCSLFFFFDRYAIGGAQRVYLDILESVNDIPKTVYFTRQSPNDKLKQRFYNLTSTECHDIHFWCDNLLFRLFTVHYFSFYLNRHKTTRVLGSNSTFFYDMLPFLHHNVRTIELLHNFSYGKRGMEFFGLANYRWIDHRMVIDSNTKQNIIAQYHEYKVPEEFARRVAVVEYGVDIPASVIKPPTPPLKVLYAGRGSKQKRIWLLNAIAAHFITNNIPVEFTFAGSMGNELSETVKTRCNVLSEIGDQKTMSNLFSTHHVIVLTSAFEGFPVVVKEGMSFGCVPVVTALAGNKIHLDHLNNALLIQYVHDEDKVVEEGINNITLLLSTPELLKRLSENAYTYAQKKFGKQEFLSAYRNLLK